MSKLEWFIKNYWKYYLRLESEFLSTLKYVEFDELNFNTFSLEYLNLFLSICSEIDVVGKLLAHEQNSTFKAEDNSNNINKWWFEIQSSFRVNGKTLSEQSANFFDVKLIYPWADFATEWITNSKGSRYIRLVQSPKAETPSWWSAYNAVKHNRTASIDTTKTNYSKANLQNVSSAFSALFILEHAYIISIARKTDLELIQKSKLFEKETKMIFEFEGTTLNLNEKEKMF